jgi:hypothetical protein
LKPFKRKTCDVTCSPACSAANQKRYHREWCKLYQNRSNRGR